MKILFTFCCLLLVYLLSAQEIRLAYNKQQILLGEQLQVKATTLVNRGQSAAFFSIDSLPHLEVLESFPIDSTDVGDKIGLTQLLTVTSWDSGRWKVPVVLLNGVPQKTVTLDVVYSSPWNGAQPYHDIKGIVPVAHPGKSSWWWYIIGLAVLIALFLLFFPADKKEKATELDQKAYKKAMQQLEKLQQKGSGNAKEYHTELVNIFRGYLKGARGIHSFTKTTDDLSIQLQTLKLPSEAYTQLVQALRLSDLVKFARYQPEGQLNQQTFNTIQQSITTIEHHPHAV